MHCSGFMSINKDLLTYLLHFDHVGLLCQTCTLTEFCVLIRALIAVLFTVNGTLCDGSLKPKYYSFTYVQLYVQYVASALSSGICGAVY